MIAFNSMGGQSVMNYPVDPMANSLLPVDYAQEAARQDMQRYLDNLEDTISELEYAKSELDPTMAVFSPSAGTDWSAAGTMSHNISSILMASPLFRLSVVA